MIDEPGSEVAIAVRQLAAKFTGQLEAEKSEAVERGRPKKKKKLFSRS